MNNPSVSIIVPIFNAEQFLPQCIESIISQSYDRIELILINDGSNDGSLNICNFFQEKDKRIKVIDKPNEGASVARNVGLELATGELIWFIDADDWIEPNSLAKLIHEMNDDILYFGYIKHHGNHVSTCQITPDSLSSLTNKDVVLSDLFNSIDAFFGFTWNKIFKRNILQAHNINFNEKLIIKEDEVFTLDYCKHIKTIGISSLTPYNYRIIESSTSHCGSKKKNMVSLSDHLINNIDSYSFGIKMRTSLLHAISRYYFDAIIENRHNECIDSIIDKYLNFIKNYNLIGQLSLKQKILMLINSKNIKKHILKLYLKLLYHDN